MAKKSSNFPIKGTLDISPKEMQKHNCIYKAITSVASRFHFEKYDLPILESWETFAQKSSDEILQEQSYHFIDRGGRKLILRPEITPSLARVVSKNVKSLALPLRWYTIGQCYRYENPQMGRLREFYQLNFDILGKNHPLFDVEIIRIVVAILSDLGLTQKHYTIHYNHRNIVNNLLESHLFSETEKKDFFYIIDRYEKWEPAFLQEQLEKKLKTKEKIKLFKQFLQCQSAQEIQENLMKNKNTHTEDFEKFFRFEKMLEACEIAQYCKFSPCIVRGFDYYTGMVFEVFDQSKSIRRSIFGGGRYDNLIARYSDEKVSGVGFGMGIYILLLFLEKLGLIKNEHAHKKRIMIAPLEENCVNFALKVSKELAQNAAVEVTTPAKIKAHFKKAEQKEFTHLVLLGEKEIQQQNFTLRDLLSGEEVKKTLK